MKRRFWFVALTGTALITLCLSPVQAQRGNKGVKQNYMVRAQFRDASTDGVRSDQLNPFNCTDDGKPYDYIHGTDTCAPGVHKTASYVTISNDTYFLAPRASTDPCPTRFLVLDFHLPDNTMCPELGLATNSSCGGLIPPKCSFTVRFFAENAFTSGATSSAVEIWIEDFPDGAPYWLTRYKLIFINPLTRTLVDGNPNIVSIGAINDDFNADLYELLSSGRKKRLDGPFFMPLQLTLTKTSQIFQ